MKAILGVLLVAVVAMTLIPSGFAQTVSDQTAAGLLEIKSKGQDGNCQATIAGKLIRAFDCRSASTPKIIAHDSFGIGRLADVIVVQEQPSGTGCNGGAVHILGVEKSGSCEVSTAINYCGGPDPVVEKKGAKILISLPGGAAAGTGSGQTTATVWEYSDGKLLKTK